MTINGIGAVEHRSGRYVSGIMTTCVQAQKFSYGDYAATIFNLMSNINS